MPALHRDRDPDLYYEIDDYTDPWRNASYILLQHGFGRSSKFWYRCVPYLARFYRVIRPDLRGFGRSSPSADPPDEFTIEACIRDVEAILDAVGAESVHYCGESLGGILGMPFAAERPRRVRTLTLISSRVKLNQSSQEYVAHAGDRIEQLLCFSSARFVVLLFVLTAATAGAATGSFPVKPIRFISPFAPGGGNDTISRMLAQAMAKIDVVGSTPEQFAAYIRTEMGKWAKVVKATGMTLQ